MSTFNGQPPQDDGNYIPQLYFKSGWTLHPCENPEVERAMKQFLSSTCQEQHRYYRLILSNIFPHHWWLIKLLRNHDEYKVVEADKNLGNCILNWNTYIRRAFEDHLGNTETLMTHYSRGGI
jgi:hypothetical protein